MSSILSMREKSEEFLAQQIKNRTGANLIKLKI